MNRFARIVLAILTILAFSDRSSAAIRPYASAGAAQFISPTQFIGAGHATHLGSYSEAGTVAFSPTGDPAVLAVEGAITYTAADGSELWALVTGQLNGATGAVTATLTYIGGTGRFDHASGSSSLAGQVAPNGSMQVAVSGTIGY